LFAVDPAFSGVNGKRKLFVLCALCAFAVKNIKVFYLNTTVKLNILRARAQRSEDPVNPA
jgi:hypothetical protein